MKRYAYIDALRGYAVLGVIMVHAAQHTHELSGPLLDFAKQGKRGVQLSFVVSALTLMMSWHHRNDGVGRFLVRRAFRIAPMFWLAILFFGLLAEETDWSNIAASATFIHALHPTTIMSTVPGGWSIGVEMLFYAIFPVIALWLRSWRGTAILLAIVILVAPRLSRLFPAAMWPELGHIDLGLYSTLWLPKQLPAFLIGVLIYHLLNQVEELPKRTLESIVAVSAALILLSPFLPFFGGLYPISGLFGVLAFALARGGGTRLVRSTVCSLGLVSYSAYHVHFAVLRGVDALQANGLDPLASFAQVPYFITLCAFVIATTTAISMATYCCIEQPCIAFGRRLLSEPNIFRVFIPRNKNARLFLLDRPFRLDGARERQEHRRDRSRADDLHS